MPAQMRSRAWLPSRGESERGRPGTVQGVAHAASCVTGPPPSRRGRGWRVTLAATRRTPRPPGSCGAGREVGDAWLPSRCPGSSSPRSPRNALPSRGLPLPLPPCDLARPGRSCPLALSGCHCGPSLSSRSQDSFRDPSRASSTLPGSDALGSLSAQRRRHLRKPRRGRSIVLRLGGNDFPLFTRATVRRPVELAPDPHPDQLRPDRKGS